MTQRCCAAKKPPEGDAVTDEDKIHGRPSGLETRTTLLTGGEAWKRESTILR
jgi:hypothetical protein